MESGPLNPRVAALKIVNMKSAVGFTLSIILASAAHAASLDHGQVEISGKFCPINIDGKEVPPSEQGFSFVWFKPDQFSGIDGFSGFYGRYSARHGSFSTSDVITLLSYYCKPGPPTTPAVSRDFDDFCRKGWVAICTSA